MGLKSKDELLINQGLPNPITQKLSANRSAGGSALPRGSVRASRPACPGSNHCFGDFLSIIFDGAKVIDRVQVRTCGPWKVQKSITVDQAHPVLVRAVLQKTYQL